jgi:ribosome-associated heat shock protein Hsp15
VPLYCTDLTPASEFEKVKLQRMQHVLARAQGSGRPTKRERREVDRYFG